MPAAVPYPDSRETGCPQLSMARRSSGDRHNERSNIKTRAGFTAHFGYSARDRVLRDKLGAGRCGFGSARLAAFHRAGQRRRNAFQNVRIFDGRRPTLSDPSNVLVKDGVIERISASPIAIDANAKVRTIAADGRVLMPGLIDAHWHAFMAATPQMVLMTADPNYLQLLAARQAEATLMRGFTTVRDLGGPVFGLKRATDEGVTVGPRIYPSGAFISQTSGHGDFRFFFELPRATGGPLSYSEVEGIAAIADSPDEVRLRAREQLRRGASQIKLMAGGGVASPYNPIESTQYTEPEVRAAVEAADNWGTYVTVHAYTPRAIRQALAPSPHSGRPRYQRPPGPRRYGPSGPGRPARGSTPLRGRRRSTRRRRPDGGQ